MSRWHRERYMMERVATSALLIRAKGLGSVNLWREAVAPGETAVDWSGQRSSTATATGTPDIITPTTTLTALWGCSLRRSGNGPPEALHGHGLTDPATSAPPGGHGMKNESP